LSLLLAFVKEPPRKRRTAGEAKVLDTIG